VHLVPFLLEQEKPKPTYTLVQKGMESPDRRSELAASRAQHIAGGVGYEGVSALAVKRQRLRDYYQINSKEGIRQR